jgi:hypothetical protein
MPKQITSTDWHLEGVSVEARKLVETYTSLCDPKPTYGAVVDKVLREVLPEKIRNLVADFPTSMDRTPMERRMGASDMSETDQEQSGTSQGQQ